MLKAASLALLLLVSASLPAAEGGFKVTDQHGKVWDSTALGSGPVLVDFWATWCVPCLKSAPDLSAFQKKYEGKVRVLGLCLEDKSPEKIFAVAKKAGMHYAVAPARPSLGRAYGIRGFPTLALIKDGKVVKQLLGRHTLRDLERELGEYL